MTTANEVQSVIYAFSQRCFIGEAADGKLNLNKQSGLFKRLGAGEITVVQVHQMNRGHHQLLRELLTQYIMFLQMNQQLSFPENFLAGSSENRLDKQLLEYLCHYKWPFPQLLSKSP